jgi:uncharacterized membrane protein
VGEVERLRSLRLDHATASLQRKMIRLLVWSSVGLVVAGQLIAWKRGETVTHHADTLDLLRTLPAGHAVMLLGVLAGLATPLARTLLLAGWFARRGERVMVALSLLLVAIVLSGLLVRHHAAPPVSEPSPPPAARAAP